MSTAHAPIDLEKETRVEHARTVDDYCTEHLVTDAALNATLDAASNYSIEQGLPAIAVSASQGQFLRMQCQLQGATRILEIGSLGGYSTIWFASSSPEAKIVSIELEAHNREVALHNVAKAGYEKQVDIRLGPALEVLPVIAEEVRSGKLDKFDFVFVDADWDEQWEYFSAAIDITKKGGCICVDNVVAQLLESGAIFKKEPELIAKVGKEKRVQAVVLPTQGVKYMDGYLFAIVR